MYGLVWKPIPGLGTDEDIELATDWQEYHFTLEASKDYDNTRLAIQLGGSTVTPVWIDHEMFYEGDYVSDNISAAEPIGKITSTWGSIKSGVR